MTTRLRVSGLGLLLILAVGCGKDDPLPGPPDAAAKDGGASDLVKGDVASEGDSAPPADAASLGSDTALADTGSTSDTPLAPVPSDATPVRLDGAAVLGDARSSDSPLSSQTDVQPDSVVRDAPAVDASGFDGEGEG